MPDPVEDAPLIVDALAAAAILCTDCLARKTRLSVFRVDDAAPGAGQSGGGFRPMG